MNNDVRRQRPSIALLAVTLAGILLSAGAAFAVLSSPAAAIAPCVAHSPSGDELTFLASLQVWRNANIPGSHQLTQSAPLNAAAQGYAQFLADTPGAGGHNADGTPGFAWATRAVNCGYPANQAAGGEGVANATTAGQALTVMTGQGGGGVWVPSNVGAPVKCVGVGKGTSSNGSKTSWVVLLFAAFGDCPGASAGGTQPSATTPATSSATNSPTPTNTATPTKTPTPSPTPRADGAILVVYEGWNLVALPPGPVAEVLHRAEGCYRAIYQQSGDRWLRYSPEAPAYANNLQTLNGGTLWVEGTAANCGVVPL